jgi:glycosyltransferase involved in cell wall biosynthesis
MLLDAVESLTAHYPKLALICIGGPVEQYQTRYQKKQPRPQIQFLGYQSFEQTAGYLQLADIAIDPKDPLSTQASGKILNYMAAGLPVIAFASPITRACIGDETYLASEHNAESLSQKIIHCMKLSHAEREQLGEAYRQRITQNYSWTATAQAILKTYQAAHQSHHR